MKKLTQLRSFRNTKFFQNINHNLSLITKFKNSKREFILGRFQQNISSIEHLKVISFMFIKHTASVLKKKNKIYKKEEIYT